MIYPDEEKVTYSYNLGGQLEKVRGYKSYGYDYVNRIGYDKFEQRTYLKYCNGAETFYTYEPARRRLQNLTVNAGGKSIMDNGYTYDAVSNVLSVANKAALHESGKAGGQMAHAYTYDALYRLASATGTYAGADSKTASYRLEMATTTCTASCRRSSISHSRACSSTVRSMWAMTWPIPTARLRAGSSSWPK